MRRQGARGSRAWPRLINQDALTAMIAPHIHRRFDVRKILNGYEKG